MPGVIYENRYRRRLNRLWFAWFAGAPALIVLTVAFVNQLPVLLVLMVIYGGAISILAFRIKCPKCRKPVWRRYARVGSVRVPWSSLFAEDQCSGCGEDLRTRLVPPSAAA